MKIRLGYWDKTCKDQLYYPGAAHGIVVANSRKGKFRDIEAAMGLTLPHSLFMNDPKGQATAVFGRCRRDVLKQRVFVFNPFNILPGHLGGFEHAQYCPVASKLHPDSPTIASDADNLAEGWLPLTSRDQHWVISARQLVSGLAIYLRQNMDQYSLPDIYTVLCSRELHGFCEHALTAGASEEVAFRIGRFAGEDAMENKEIRSIVSSAITGLGWVGNKMIADNMRRSTIDNFGIMKKEGVTVSVILPARYMMSCAPWIRTITNAWADDMLREDSGDHRVVGLLQEFATSVGNLNSIDTLNAMGAGFNCQLISEFQDLNQLVELKPKSWQTWLANAGFHIYLGAGIGDLFTSTHISNMSGTIDVPNVSRSINDNQGQGYQLATGFVDGINRSLRSLAGGGGTQVSIGSRQRPYLLPEDVRECDNDEMLVFAEGVRGVIRAGRKPYYQSPEFAGKFDEDPYHAKKR